MNTTTKSTVRTIAFALLACLLTQGWADAQFVGSNDNPEGLPGAWQVTSEADVDIKFLFSVDGRVRVVINGDIKEGTVDVDGDQVTINDPSNGNSLEFTWERSANGLTLTTLDGSKVYEMERFDVSSPDQESDESSDESQDDSMESEETDASNPVPTMGPIAEVLSLEDDGTWRGVVVDEAYHLVNPEAADAIRYYYIDADESYGSRTVQAQAGAVDGEGMAGLLYGFEEDPKQYYMLVVDGEGTIRLLFRGQDGVSEKFSATLGDDQEAGAGEPVKLAMVEDGANVEIFVNDKSLGSFSSDATGKGGVGIVAIGIVDAMFKDFEVKTK